MVSRPMGPETTRNMKHIRHDFLFKGKKIAQIEGSVYNLTFRSKVQNQKLIDSIRTDRYSDLFN